MFYAFAQAEQAEKTTHPWPYPMSWMGPPAPIGEEPWMITLAGLNGEKLSLSLKDLDLLPQKSLSRRWVSHNGWSVRCEWQGVLVQHLIEKLRPPHGQPLYIQQTNAQGFSETLTLKEMVLHRPMLVRAVNGQPLPAEFGGPLSLMVFHCYGYKGLSQVTQLSLTDKPNHQWSQHWGLSSDGAFMPGMHFAWDMGTPQPIKRTTEVEDY